MQTIVGTVVYFDDIVFDVKVKCPFLYVSKNEKYKLESANSQSDFEKYDGVKVEMTGMLYGDILQVETVYRV